MNNIKTETEATYSVMNRDDAIIAQALAILDSRMRKAGEAMTSPGAVRDYLRIKLTGLEHEVRIPVNVTADSGHRDRLRMV